MGGSFRQFTERLISVSRNTNLVSKGKTPMSRDALVFDVEGTTKVLATTDLPVDDRRHPGGL